MKKAEKIFNSALENATKLNDVKYLYVYADKASYPKRLKQQIIQVALAHGFKWKLDDKKLYNQITKRWFTCNNIINA